MKYVVKNLKPIPFDAIGNMISKDNFYTGQYHIFGRLEKARRYRNTHEAHRAVTKLLQGHLAHDGLSKEDFSIEELSL